MTVQAHKVCTAEAVVSALVAVSALTVAEGQWLLDLASEKVQRTVAYQGKPRSLCAARALSVTTL